ncbi:MAG: hypothetical protein ABIG84_06630 [archaeon]
MDYRQYYNIESYLLDTVQPRFAQEGQLSADDFFCIVIWKANRSKSKIAKILLGKHKNLDIAIQSLTTGLSQQPNAKEKLRYLIKDWDFHLPMASAILTILYPNEFTVYDTRVCATLRKFHKLKNRKYSENLWHEYQKYKQEVEKSTPNELNLRDKDRYLWGKSFYEQLRKDIENEFNVNNG